MKKKSNQKKKVEDKSNKKHKAHDLLFKAVFSKRREAANLLRNFVNPDLVKGLDLRTLRRETDSFTEPQLKEYLSDLVYSCRWKGKQVRICLLFEHKSTPVDYPHFQLLRYMLNAWEQDIAQKRPLQAIIPILVYHGKKRWQYKKLSDYFDIPDELILPYLPNFEYNLLDLSQFSDKRILKLKKGYYVNTLYLLKHQKQKTFLLNHIKEAFINIDSYINTEEGRTFFKTMLQYLYKTNNFEKEETEYLMENIFKTEISDIDPNNIDNTYDRLLYEGYIKGEVAGVEKGIEKGREDEKIEIAKKAIQKFPNWTDKEVAEFLEITLKKVKEIRKSLG